MLLIYFFYNIASTYYVIDFYLRCDDIKIVILAKVP